MVTIKKDLASLNDNLNNNQGVMSILMRDLRDEAGYDRLGIQVRKAISDKLRGMGIDHCPLGELPGDQDKWVLLYRQGTPVERIIRVILEPEDQSGDLLRQVVEIDAEQFIESERVLQAIRELVGF